MNTEAPAEQKPQITENAAPRMNVSVNPGQRIADLAISLGALQTQVGLVLRFGPQNPDPVSGQKILMGFVTALAVLEDSLAAVKSDIAKASEMQMQRQHAATAAAAAAEKPTDGQTEATDQAPAKEGA